MLALRVPSSAERLCALTITPPFSILVNSRAVSSLVAGVPAPKEAVGSSKTAAANARGITLALCGTCKNLQCGTSPLTRTYQRPRLISNDTLDCQFCLSREDLPGTVMEPMGQASSEIPGERRA